MKFDLNKNINFSINGKPIDLAKEDKNKVVKIVKLITKIFSCVALVLGVAAIVCFVFYYKNATREYEIIEGVIIDFDERRSSSSGTGSRKHRSSSRTYAPVFTFEYNGQTLTNTHSVSSSSYGGKRSKYQIGSTVDVRIYNNKPNRANIDDGFADKILLLVGAVLSFMAIIFFTVSQLAKKLIFKTINSNINKDENQDNMPLE